MTRTGVGWDDLIWDLVCSAPAFIAMCVALYFCYVRRRENPKGATFLGLAILVAFAQVTLTALVFYFPLVYRSDDAERMATIPFQGFALFMDSTVGNAAKWILVTLAVFARRPH